MQRKGRVALCLKMSMFGDERQLCNRRRVNYYPSVTLRQRDMFAVDPTNVQLVQNDLTVDASLKGQSQLLKGRPIYSNDCGKYSLCQLDHGQ